MVQMDFTVNGPFYKMAYDCESILRSLPDWFGIEAAIVHYIEIIDSLPTFLVHQAGQTLGFLRIKPHNPFGAEVYVMGVRLETHRKVYRYSTHYCSPDLAERTRGRIFAGENAGTFAQ